MKSKILIFLILFSLGICKAQNLQDSFKEIAKIKGFTLINPSTFPLDLESKSFMVQAAAVTLDNALNKEELEECYNILNTVPLQRMVIGAMNNNCFGLIYADPSDDDEFNILIVGNDQGTVAAVLCKGDSGVIDTFKSSEVIMKKDTLSVMLPSEKGENHNYIFDFK